VPSFTQTHHSYLHSFTGGDSNGLKCCFNRPGMEHPSPQAQHQQLQATPEQQLSHQQLVINNLSAWLVAMEETASVTAAAFELRLAAASNHSPEANRYKAANPTSFSGVSDTLRPWIRQMETLLQLAAINDPEVQFLVAAQFLSAAPLTWVHILTGVNTWTDLRARMVTFYPPLHEERRARDSLHDLRQRGSVDNYAKAFTLLVVRCPR
jgi:Retrotransposon gag protein